MNLSAFSSEVRAAAERFERETGRRLDAYIPRGPISERMIALPISSFDCQQGSPLYAAITCCPQSPEYAASLHTPRQ